MKISEFGTQPTVQMIPQNMAMVSFLRDNEIF